MWSIALRPRWIAALVVALGVAAGFVLLSQWQISRSVATGTVVERPTEKTLPLAEVATPQQPMTATADGQRVRVSGDYLPEDTIVLSDRINHDERGYWVVAHLAVDAGSGGSGAGTDVAVALGWTASEAKAHDVASNFAGGSVTVEGRLVADEGPQTSDFQEGELSALSMGALVNLWSTIGDGGVYNGYIVSDSPAAGLERIDAPRPDDSVQLNLLNVFYAAEWVIFAGFAVFLWWRLVRDVWERERAEVSVE